MVDYNSGLGQLLGGGGGIYLLEYKKFQYILYNFILLLGRFFDILNILNGYPIYSTPCNSNEISMIKLNSKKQKHNWPILVVNFGIIWPKPKH